jgi:hypothetical protein
MEPTHPRLRARGTHSNEPTIRAMVYAPSVGRLGWIESELARRTDTLVQVGRTVRQVVFALLDDPPPRPQVLILDFDAIDAGELMYLHTIREQGWCGAIVGLGVVPTAIRKSMNIDRVLNTPFVRDSLREAIGQIGFTTQTTRIPVFDDDELALPIAPPLNEIVFSARAKNARISTRRS